jgi:selenide,water dikinase
LLVACSQSRAENLVKEIVAAGYPSAKVIGTAEAGKPGVRVIA